MSDFKTKFEEAVREEVTRRGLAVEKLTKEQFVQALMQAIECGDFQRQVTVDGRQCVTYIPFREEMVAQRRIDELEGEVEELKAKLAAALEALHG